MIDSRFKMKTLQTYHELGNANNLSIIYCRNGAVRRADINRTIELIESGSP